MKYTSASVHQLKNRKGKPWQARLKYKDPTGKWKEISKMLPEAKGKKEAERIAREWQDEMNKTSQIVPSTPSKKRDRQTVQEVCEQYLQFQVAMGIIEKSTARTYSAQSAKRVYPYIGDILFLELDRVAIADWITKLSQEGLSQQYIYLNVSMVSRVYSYYQTIGEIFFNPFKQVKFSKPNSKRKTHLIKEQMDELVTAVHEDYVPEDKMYPAIFLAFYGGLRRQEICALRWNDVDFEGGTLTVSSAIGNMKGGNYTKTPKNNSSFRTFPMIPQLQEVLEEVYLAKQPKREWYVCGDKDNYMHLSTFSGNFSRFVKRHGLEDAYGKHVISHGLRHNLGAVGIRSEMDIASLALMMGHASRSMTLDIYGDANEDAKLVGAQKLSATFQREMDEAQGYEVSE